jgi:TonB family protein
VLEIDEHDKRVAWISDPDSVITMVESRQLRVQMITIDRPRFIMRYPFGFKALLSLLLSMGIVSSAAKDTVYIAGCGPKGSNSNYPNKTQLDSICSGLKTQLTDSLGRKKIIRVIRGSEIESGCRDKDSLFQLIYRRIYLGLRYAYNKRLREKPGIQGHVITKLSINPAGDITNVQILESTMRDTIFENELIFKVRRWKFEAETRNGCNTVVICPFSFAQ